MATMGALRAAEELTDDSHFDEEYIGKGLVVALITTCPHVLTMTSYNLDRIARWAANLSPRAQLFYEDLLLKLVASPDFYEVYPDGSNSELVEKIRTKTVRPAPVSPELGIHYTEGGDFAVWWSDYTDWLVAKVKSLSAA